MSHKVVKLNAKRNHLKYGKKVKKEKSTSTNRYKSNNIHCTHHVQTLYAKKLSNFFLLYAFFSTLVPIYVVCIVKPRGK